MSRRPQLGISACISALCFFLIQAPAPASAQTTETTQTAEELGDAAYQLQADGKYAEAIATYLKAYELSQASVLLYNIGHLYDRKLNERELAAAYYRRYSSAPDADPALVKKATERLTVLKQAADAEAAKNLAEQAQAQESNAPSEPASAPPPKPAEQVATDPKADRLERDKLASSRGSGLRTAGVITGAVGVAAVGASLVLGLLAKNKNSDADAVCDGVRCRDEKGVALARSAGQLADAATISFFSGVGLLGAGVSLYVLAPSAGSTGGTVDQPRTAYLPSVGLNVRGKF